MSHAGEYRFHDDDCLCKTAGIEYCNRNGSIWSCCGHTDPDSPGCDYVAPPPPSVAKPPPQPTAVMRPSRPPPPRRVWYWSGKLERRRRRYRFVLTGGELSIPARPLGPDDMEPERPEQADFLDEQRDLLRRVFGDAWEFDASMDIEAELKRRLDATQ